MAKEFEVGIEALEVYNHGHDIVANECALAFHKYLLHFRVKFLLIFFGILTGQQINHIRLLLAYVVDQENGK